MNEDFLRGKPTQLEVEKYDKPCEKCGTIISFSKGVGDCPRCHGLPIDEQIDLHIQQAEEHEVNKNLGIRFGSAFVILAIAMCFFMF